MPQIASDTGAPAAPGANSPPTKQAAAPRRAQSPKPVTASPHSTHKEWATRMTFTVAYWAVASLAASLIDGKTISAPTLVPALIAYFQEQIDLGVIVFELVVLAVVGLLATLFVSAWQREIKMEVFRLYYTMGAAAGGLSLAGGHWDKVLLFYGAGVFVPWLMVRIKVPFLNLD